MTTSGDDDLKGLFDELRSQEIERVRPFAHVVGRARRASPAPSIPRIALAAVLGIAVVLGLAILPLVRGKSSPVSAPPPEQWTMLQWRSSTDFLLRTPGYEVVETVPTFLTSVPRIELEAETSGKTGAEP